ncbi:MAG: ABC transporter ATP-binding protein [Actinomycetota bacterium]
MTARLSWDGGPSGGLRDTGERIAVADVTMEYASARGRVRALHDVSLSVEPGSSLAVVGPSGCGKSTLLGLLGGLEVPTRGQVQVGEHRISAMAEADRATLRRRVFGFLFQADNLQPFLTVAENVGLQSVLAGLDDEAVHRQSLLDELDIGGLARRYPDQLSGGQRQRVAVGRALVHGPGVVLADEPTGSLDAVNSNRVVALLLRLHRERGATLVVVTHDRSVAARMDAVIELRGGAMKDGSQP